MKINYSIQTFALILLALLTACNHIKKGNELSASELARINHLFHLDADEKVYQFYSEFKSKVAGNFFSNKRIASYWLDENDKTKNQINFARYADIIAIDTVFNAGATYYPYMLITRKDSSRFRVSADGNKTEVNAFFKDAINKWKQSKK